MRGWEDVTPEEAAKMAYSRKTAQKGDSEKKKAKVSSYTYYTEKARMQALGEREEHLSKPKRQGKYNAKKTLVDGFLFDSRAEAEYYSKLKLMQRAGKILRFELQPEYVLQEGFYARSGERIRPIKYIADFLVYYADGHKEVVDVKGMKTEVYKLKRKWFLHKYPEIQLIEIGGRSK